MSKPQSRKKLSDEEIISLCEEQYTSAISIEEIQQEREDALNRYNSKPYGDEIAGQSTVLTSEVYDTIEAIMPDLVEQFIGDDNPVYFEPRGAEDVETSEIETNYCNYVFNQLNHGFMIARTWIFDALVQKNGIVRAYWDEFVATENEIYKNITEMDLMQIATDDDVEVKSLTGYDAAGNETDTMPVTFDIEVERKSNNSQIRIENVPPENFVVTRNHNSISLDDCDYCCARMGVSESELMDEGISWSEIQEFPDYTALGTEEISRRQGAGDNSFDTSTSQNRMKEIRLHFIRMDKGQGFKLYRIRQAGNTMIDCEPADRVEYHVLCPVPQAHRFYGKGKAEEAISLQRINTVLMRQTLNNLTLANNPMKLVKRNANVDMKSLLAPELGKVVLTGDVGAVVDLAVPFVAGQTLPFFEFLDGVRERRTGVSQAQQGLTPEVLANSTNMVGGMLMNKAQARIKLIARTFAETGFRSLMLHIHELSTKYQQQVKMIDFGGGFVEVDPRKWRKRTAMRVRIGIGYTEKQQQVANVTSMISEMKEVILNNGRIADEGTLYEAYMDLGKLVGTPQVKKYFKNPAELPPETPEPTDMDKQLALLEKQSQIDAAKKAAELEQKTTQSDKQLAFDAYKFDQETQLKYDELRLQYGQKDITAYEHASLDLEKTKLKHQVITQAESKGMGREELMGQLEAIDRNLITDEDDKLLRSHRAQIEAQFETTHQMEEQQERTEMRQSMEELKGLVATFIKVAAAPREIVIKRDSEKRIDGATVGITNDR